MGKWGLDGFDENPIIKIEATKDRWNKAKKDLEDAKYIEGLIYNDYIRSIKSYKTAWEYRIPTIKSALDELLITDKKKKRPNLDSLNTWIKEDFFPEINVEIKVNKIISYGYESYSWQLNFEVNGETLAICIPHKEKIYAENIEHASYGQFAFMRKTGESSWKVCETKYSEENLAECIKDYF